MERQTLDLDLLLDDPFVQTLPSGESVRMNRAFEELAVRHGVAAELPLLFGPSVLDLMSKADGTGRASGYLAVLGAPPPGQTFRAALKSTGGGGPISVLLVDVSDDVAWRRQLFDRNRDLTVLNAIGAALSGMLELDVLAFRILEQTRRIMRATNFQIALWDREAGVLSFPIYVEDQALRQMPRRPFANGISEHVLRTRRPLLLTGDVPARARELGIEPVGRLPAAWLGAPMLAGEEALGVIAMQDFEDSDAFDQHDLEVLTIIAGQAAAAIRNARLLADARTTYRKISETQGRLLESERLRGVTETVGALNHEVNNPLAAIVGNAQLLLRHSEELSPELRRKIEIIHESARRIQRVTGKMATLIQATSMPYPGKDAILDVQRSIAIDETPAAGETAGDGAAPPGDSAAAG